MNWNMTGLAGGSPLDHVRQHPITTVPAETTPLTPAGEITLFSDQIAMMILAGLLLIFVLPALLRRRAGSDDIGSLVPTGAANALEAICDFLRKEVVEPNLHGYTDRFIKFFWSLFFFILTINLLGLIPFHPVTALFLPKAIGGTATANIWVTATLAILCLLIWVYNGVTIGGKEYFAHFCPGPMWLAPLLVPLEVIGLVAKVFSLAVRLFANMMAGHVLLAVLLGFILSAGQASVAAGLGIAVPVIAGSVAIFMLEIFVACLQAFIFTFLAALFLGQSIVFHHGEDHAHAH
ncbi:MAG: F0F1 ATP synthase subunit A [Acidobacteriota bacterium]